MSKKKRLVDWAIGMNASVAMRLKMSKLRYNWFIAVGRFQTPVLNALVERQEQISKFVSQEKLQLVLPFRISGLFSSFFFSFEIFLHISKSETTQVETCWK